MSRVKKERIELDRQQVSDFFERRAQTFDPKQPLTAVLYQDAHPEVASRRDALEKRQIEPLLRLTGSERVLDIGCGIGRWAQTIKDKIDIYHGIDASMSLVNIARERCIQSNIFFHPIGVEAITDDWLTANGLFNRVIISGILLYLDDIQVKTVLSVLARHLAVGGLVYLREPMGVEERLTLNSHWSEELSAHYSAIYRSRAEIREMLTESFPEERFLISPLKNLFSDEDLNNRLDTCQYFCFVERHS
ncbi:class I SAM-dependent DNA methyltransferase [Asaia spathodeae]|uniref:Class I SAM-dependent methyltransferase n=1 Tax=Asaia spathodeae TaxID=657016 RepID=A0ABX2P8H7_9PROT|nr:class I SAM-dependent methyltransferase [Asaia spathodeae]GBR12857.1 SAM-dependent methyltransferase [Asaia spathodeae NBRC 105894]